MDRRDFLKSTSSGLLVSAALGSKIHAELPGHDHGADHAACGPTYASPAEAMKAPRETLAYVPAIYSGTSVNKPDYLAVIDVDPQSKRYSQVIHRVEMPHLNDELHHFGWNACSSCHGQADRMRRFLIVPGLASGNIHILDAKDPQKPVLHKVISGKEVREKTNLSGPHTVHCLPDGNIMLSMLGDGDGNAPGGFLLLSSEFEIVGRWEKSTEGMSFNYDFWYQPRHNVMISSEWAAPNTVRRGFNPKDVAAGHYGHKLNFWNWSTRELQQSIDLGEQGLVPLEVRFHHNPDSPHGFVGTALSSSVWHWWKDGEKWQAEKVIQVDPVEAEGWPFPVPGLITDIILSMDDRWLYFSNWLHGDLRQYDVSDPRNPRLAGQVWLGGVLKHAPDTQRPVRGGPQMLQISLDGKRLYVTNSLYSVWDNQFYPDIAKEGSHLVMIDCDTERGGMRINERFFVDFKNEPYGPARAHEIRFPGGDSTSDIWV